jgi:membrane fusion protein, copper/silver efflux system
MTGKPPKSALRRWIPTIVFTLVLVGAGIVLRDPLVAWFSGESTETTVAPAVTVSSAAAAETTPTLPKIEYPPAAFDALRSAIDAVERARATLTQDKVDGLSAAASSAAEALRAAHAAVPKDRRDVADVVLHAAAHADELGKSKTLEDARKAFASFNGTFLPIVALDSRLTAGLNVFECPMFEHARWMQHGTIVDNPYMGTKMPTCGTASSFEAKTPAAGTTDADSSAIDHYTCSMHPSVKQAGPGKCPICGMDLIPVTKAQQEQGVVLIDEARRQLIGVRTGLVVEAPLSRAFRAVGHVTYDESALTDVNLKVGGWITKLFVNRTGQHVTVGQPLFLLFSPELYSAEQDFLLATQGGGTVAAAGAAPSRVEALGRAARQRLHLLGLGEGQIQALEKSRSPSESISVPAPASGFVIQKDVVEGASVEAGMRLYQIAALNKVWVEADVYEADLPHVQVGQKAIVTLDYLPGHSYDAKVSYIYPYLDPTARTGRVRVELANKELELRPGMYASVALASDAETRLQVPAAAIVYTGPRRLVFVDLGEGRFKPQEVRVGTEANGMYEVLSGLKAGDSVATSGVFLIAAEARISTAAKYWDKSPADSESGAEAPAGAAPTMPSGSAMPMKAAPAPPPVVTPMNMPLAARPTDRNAKSPKVGAPAPAPPATVFTCPMHPEVKSTTPGKCPKCGMNLEPVPSGGGK